MSVGVIRLGMLHVTLPTVARDMVFPVLGTLSMSRPFAVVPRAGTAPRRAHMLLEGIGWCMHGVLSAGD